MKESFSKKAVGERLKGFRLSMHMTQKEFAEEMHWDVNTYRKIETGCSLLTSDKHRCCMINMRLISLIF